MIRENHPKSHRGYLLYEYYKWLDNDSPTVLGVFTNKIDMKYAIQSYLSDRFKDKSYIPPILKTLFKEWKYEFHEYDLIIQRFTINELYKLGL